MASGEGYGVAGRTGIAKCCCSIEVRAAALAAGGVAVRDADCPLGACDCIFRIHAAAVAAGPAVGDSYVFKRGAEVGVNTDCAAVAGVFYRRIQADMPVNDAVFKAEVFVTGAAHIDSATFRRAGQIIEFAAGHGQRPVIDAYRAAVCSVYRIAVQILVSVKGAVGYGVHHSVRRIAKDRTTPCFRGAVCECGF